MSNTPGGLPYPEPSDLANQGAGAIKSLALALDSNYGYFSGYNTLGSGVSGPAVMASGAGAWAVNKSWGPIPASVQGASLKITAAGLYAICWTGLMGGGVNASGGTWTLGGSNWTYQAGLTRDCQFTATVLQLCTAGEVLNFTTVQTTGTANPFYHAVGITKLFGTS